MENTEVISFRSVQYLSITQRWKVQIENFEIESKFLHFLFEDYFACYFSDFFNAKLKVLETRLSKLDLVSQERSKKLIGQLFILQMMVDGKIKENTTYLAHKQLTLEKEIDNFSIEFSSFKKDLYQFVQHMSSCHERFSLPC